MKAKKILGALVVCFLMCYVNYVSASVVYFKNFQPNLLLSETYTLKIKGLPKNSKIQWSSTNKKVATIDKNGKIVAKGYGHTTIKAKFNGGTLSNKMYVREPKLSKSKLKININKTEILQLKNVPKDSDEISWSNSNSKVAIVSVMDFGKNYVNIQAKETGTTIIKAVFKGKEYSCKVTVVDPSIVQDPSTVSGTLIPSDQTSSNLRNNLFVILIPIKNDEINGGNVTKYVDHFFSSLFSTKYSDGLTIVSSSKYNNYTINISNLKSGSYYLLMIDRTKQYTLNESFNNQFNKDIKIFEELFSEEDFEELKSSIIRGNYAYNYYLKQINLKPNQITDISYDFTKYYNGSIINVGVGFPPQLFCV